MKKLLLIWLLGVGVLGAEEKKEEALLAAVYKEVIANSKAQTTEALEFAKQSKFAADLVPAEKATGEAWTELIDHVRGAGDRELEVKLLRLEMSFLLTAAYYDLETAENQGQQMRAQKQIEVYKNALKDLKGMLEKKEEAE